MLVLRLEAGIVECISTSMEQCQGRSGDTLLYETLAFRGFEFLRQCPVTQELRSCSRAGGGLCELLLCATDASEKDLDENWGNPDGQQLEWGYLLATMASFTNTLLRQMRMSWMTSIKGDSGV